MIEQIFCWKLWKMQYFFTLEQHLQILTDGPFDALATTIPSLIDGMRMIWTVS